MDAVLIIRMERVLVKEIFHNECWYLGQERDKFVPINDPEVVKKVLDIVERDGDLILEHAMRLLAA